MKTLQRLQLTLFRLYITVKAELRYYRARAWMYLQGLPRENHQRYAEFFRAAKAARKDWQKEHEA